MKYKRSIYIQTIINMEVYLGTIKVLTRSYKAEVLEVSEISL